MNDDQSAQRYAELSVMSFNLRLHMRRDGRNAWPKRIDSVVQVFLKHQPAVVGTQEGLPGMIEDLLQQLPLYHFIGNGREGEGKGEHCALFYRPDTVELLRSGQFWLSLTPDIVSGSWNTACLRICTWAEFQLVAGGRERFRVYNTHLDHKSKLAREQGSLVIWNQIVEHQKSEKMPFMVMGDMNAEPSDDVIGFWRGDKSLGWVKNGSPDTGGGQERFTTHLTDVYTGAQQNPGNPGRSFHGFQGGTDGEPIDYIFVSPEIQVIHAYLDTSKYLDRYPSDHYPLVARLSLK